MNRDMADEITVHVAPSGDGTGWALRRQGALRATAVYPDQDGAIKEATNYVRRNGGELIVHAINGRIQSSRSYVPNSDSKK
jgi:hypothetical protein